MRGVSRYWPPVVISVVAVVLAGVGGRSASEREAAYPQLGAPERHLQQGLDYLTVEQNVPFDDEAAAEHFTAIAADPAASPALKDTAGFLNAWCRWTRPVPDFNGARRLLE